MGIYVLNSDGTKTYVAHANGASKNIRQDRANFISEVVNMHDELVDVCRDLLTALDNCPGEFNYDPDIEDRAKAVVALAEKKV